MIISIRNDGENTPVNILEYGIDRVIFPIIQFDNLITKRKYRDFVQYINVPMFLDTETSHNHDSENPIAWIYQWCIEFNGVTIGGRTPSQLVNLFHRVSMFYRLGESKKLVIYVHNLSYDISYLFDWLRSAYDDCKILAIKNHKILTFSCGGLEFRCSYMLSNRSLVQWSNYTNTITKKAVGEIDYNIIRYQDTPLTGSDWFYMVNDVLTLKESWVNMCKMFNDDLGSIPLTNTGYIRRDMRKASKADKKNREIFVKTQLSAHLYMICRGEFGGGLTHGNRHLCSQTIEYDIGHGDFKSHYPSVQMLRCVPVSAFELFFKYKDGKTPMTKEELLHLSEKYCTLSVIMVKNLRLKEEVTLPCLSESKCIYRENFFSKAEFYIDDKTKGTDNGRIVNMIGKAIFYFTEIDLQWFLDQYNFDGLHIMEVYYAERGHMPDWFRTTLNEYFKIKENASGTERDKAKNNLNAGYGMSATDPVRAECEFNFETYQWTESKDYSEEKIQEKLDKFYKSRNSFMPYQLGIYCTSIARGLLLDIVKNVVGYQNYIYCDTDSVFYIKTPEIEKRIAEYNRKVIDLNKSLGLGVTNKKGGISYYGVFEDESKDEGNIKAFRFLHAKCYAFRTDKRDSDTGRYLRLTLAGVSKTGRNGQKSVWELGNINNLNENMIFVECGGTTSKYVYAPPHIEYVDGHRTECASACIIHECEKHVSELNNIIDICKMEWTDMLENIK